MYKVGDIFFNTTTKTHFMLCSIGTENYVGIICLDNKDVGNSYDVPIDVEDVYNITMTEFSLITDGYEDSYVKVNKKFVIMEIMWYDDIPKSGILCWTSNHDINPHKSQCYIDLIKEFDGDKFEGINDIWKYAEPLTKEEIKEFLVK